jgi:hypothetical protein
MMQEEEKLKRWARKRLERSGIEPTDDGVRQIIQLTDATQDARNARTKDMEIDEEAYRVYRADLRRCPSLCW